MRDIGRLAYQWALFQKLSLVAEECVAAERTAVYLQCPDGSDRKPTVRGQVGSEGTLDYGCYATEVQCAAYVW